MRYPLPSGKWKDRARIAILFDWKNGKAFLYCDTSPIKIHVSKAYSTWLRQFAPKLTK